MAVARKRYYIWLLRAYFKRWNKTIISSIIVGVLFFFMVFFLLSFYILPLLSKNVEKIGYSGSYTLENIPQEILGDVSYGLTKLNPDGSISQGASYKWDIKNEGHDYVFYIRRGQYYDNGQELKAQNLNYNFADVKKRVIDDYTVEFLLKGRYAPFLTLMSKPIFGKNFSGLGAYRLQKVELNGGFVKLIILVSKNNSSYKKIINFYPTQESLKAAYALGDVDKIYGLSDTVIAGSDFKLWKNTKITKTTDYHDLVTLFFNNTDAVLSDKKIREALSYALPAEFSEGERAFSPIAPQSIFFSKSPNYGITDTDIAKNLLSSDSDARHKTLEISTTQDYENVAKKIVTAWAKIGIKAKIKITSALPSSFQVLLYPIRLPLDPDQYTLWHSGQVNNIVKYKNLRIDKLLEDGRSTEDVETRISIYADFQKYLIDDAPAAFIYFPYGFDLVRN